MLQEVTAADHRVAPGLTPRPSTRRDDSDGDRTRIGPERRSPLPVPAEGEERTKAFSAVADYEYTKDLTIVGVASLQGLMLLSDRVEYEPDALTNRNKFQLQDISFTK